MEFVRNLITFSVWNALINKILAIIFSSIKIGFYLAIILFLKNWDRDTTKLESYLFNENIIIGDEKKNLFHWF